MSKIVVLGAGMVGQAMAIDLAHSHQVTAVDVSAVSLQALEAKQPGIQTKQADLSDPNAVKRVIAAADLVIGAVPGFMGYQVLQSIIEAGKHVVDISFFNEDAFELDELAKENGVIAVVDCGVAPGMDNVICGYHDARMQVDRFECLVGGLPQVRTWPFEYKAPFSPIDVIAEYTRPARYVQDGKLVTKPALTDPEFIDFKEVGTLEAFNTDGLRSLIKTMEIPNMIERTLRYPGHIELMRVLRESGFFSEEPVKVGQHSVKPLDLTAKLLFKQWYLHPDEKEFTVMRVTVEGEEAGEGIKYVYHLYDKYDTSTQTSSMARTTGYSCTAAAQLILENKYTNTGISPPEYVGKVEGCMEAMLDYMEKRGIVYTKIVESKTPA